MDKVQSLAPPPSDAREMPLCVDLDGTLILSNVTFESFLLLIKKQPLAILLCFFWLLRHGIACLKHQIALRAQPNPTLLPYNKDFLAYLQQEHQKSRSLLLVTASSQLIAKNIANHLGIFSQVIASSATVNMKGHHKRERLNQLFGEKKYDYAGNSSDDLAVWISARKAILVNPAPSLIQQAEKIASLEKIYSSPRHWFKHFFSILRVHHYAKNLLVFVPLITAHLYFDTTAILNSLLAFIIFCILASSAYLLNDLLDLEADRQHSTKHKRGFAAANVPLMFGMLGCPILFILAFLLSIPLSNYFLICLISYYTLTIFYSFYLKKIKFVDVLTLAILYTIRIIAGIAAIQASYSLWLITFSLFLFLSLAFIKRYSELKQIEQQQKMTTVGRGYHVSDLKNLYRAGVASGYTSVVVLIGYINSAKVIMLYRYPNLLWLISFILLFWIARIWQLAKLGRITDDPVTFTLYDKTSWLLMLIACAIILIAANP